jgi:hypothetical protein
MQFFRIYAKNLIMLLDIMPLSPRIGREIVGFTPARAEN